MGYFILRNGEQYGPYAKVEVQRYLRTGEIYPGDLGRSEGMNQWLPISQVVGTGPPPLPSSGTSFSSGSSRQLPPHNASSAPDPLGLHWGIVLLLAVLTFGLFGWICSFLLAKWAHTIDPRNRAFLWLIAALAISIAAVTGFLSTANGAEGLALVALFQLVAAVLFEVAVFELRRSILQYYANLDIRLSLSRVATFFFSVVYFQFKFNRIRQAQSRALWMPIHH